jgi:hypothetical protein
MNERKIIDAITRKLDVSNGDAQGIFEAAEMTRPELFDGSRTDAEIIKELCR